MLGSGRYGASFDPRREDTDMLWVVLSAIHAASYSSMLGVRCVIRTERRSPGSSGFLFAGPRGKARTENEASDASFLR